MTGREGEDSARRWRLADDSLVVDLLALEPRATVDAMRDATKRSIVAHWRSSDTASGASQWHYNHSPPAPPRKTVLPPAPGGTQPRHGVTAALDAKDYHDWRAVWRALNRHLEIPRGCELLRVYQNVYPYGADGCAHSDSAAWDEVTMCLYLHPVWEADWGGETVLLDPNAEVHRAVLPKPGRVFAFRSAVEHSARPVARAALPPRTVLVLKMGPWPVTQPLACAQRDAVLSKRAMGETEGPGEAWRDADGATRVALATQWVLESRAGAIAHGRGSLAAHLVSTGAWLGAWGCPETTILGGLAHALCATQHFRHRAFDPLADRAALEEVFTEAGLALALAFASCDRAKLRAMSQSPPAGEGPFDIGRDAHGPEGGAAFGPLEVSAAELEALLYIDAANQLSMAGAEQCLRFERARRALG